MAKKYIVSDIIYDTDGEDVDLPSELTIEVPDDVEQDDIEEYIGDKISDKTGFCHIGYTVEPPINKL